MFCGQCGTPNADSATFCANCGAKLNGTPGVASIHHSAVLQTKNYRKIGIIAVAVIAIIAIVLVLVLTGGRGYKATVDKFIAASFEVDAEAIVDLMPDEVIDYALKDAGYDTDDRSMLIQKANDTLQDTVDRIERSVGSDWTVSHEIEDVEDVTGTDLDALKQEYENLGVKISAAKTVPVNLTVTVGSNSDSTYTKISVIKVGRSWYLDMLSMDSIF